MCLCCQPLHNRHFILSSCIAAELTLPSSRPATVCPNACEDYTHRNSNLYMGTSFALYVLLCPESLQRFQRFWNIVPCSSFFCPLAFFYKSDSVHLNNVFLDKQHYSAKIAFKHDIAVKVDSESYNLLFTMRQAV